MNPRLQRGRQAELKPEEGEGHAACLTEPHHRSPFSQQEGTQKKSELKEHIPLTGLGAPRSG